MLLAAFLLFLTYSSMVVNPAKAWYMTVLGLLFIPIVLLNILLLFWAVKRRSKSFMIPLIALLPSAIFIGRYFQFSSGAAEQSGETSVRMVSYNVGHFMLGSKPAFKGDEGRKACMDSVVRFIKETDADIVCLQEVDLDGEYDVSKFINCIIIRLIAGLTGDLFLSFKDRFYFGYKLNRGERLGEIVVIVYEVHLYPCGRY